MESGEQGDNLPKQKEILKLCHCSDSSDHDIRRLE